MGVAVNSSHVVSAAASSSAGGLLTLFPCSSVGSLPWDTVLHKLLQHGSLPRGAVLQKQVAPTWVSHEVVSSASKPAPTWAPLSMGAQVLPQACSSVGCPQVHSILQASTCSSMGSSPGCRWISAPPWTSSLPHHGFLQGLQGNLCSSAWSTSSPSFFTDLGVCGVVSLTLSHSSLWLQLLMPRGFFFPFLIILSQMCYYHI